MEEEDDVIFFLVAIVWLQTICLLLNQLKSNNRRWWMLPDKRERLHLGAYTTLFLKYKQTNHEEFFKMTRLTVEQFEELLNLINPALIKTSNREPLTPEFRLAFTVWYVVSILSTHILSIPSIILFYYFSTFSIKLYV